MSLVTRQGMADDNGDFISGTAVTKAFVDQVYDQIDDQAHSTTNPTIKPKAITDEVVTARGSKSSLDARLDVALNEDGTPKAVAGVIVAAQIQTLLGSRNVILNGDFDDWSAGAAAAPDEWTLSGAGATVVRTGPGEADTFTFGAGKYAVKVTRVGNDASLERAIVPAADIADFAEIKGQKIGVRVLAKTTVASQVRLVVDDGATQTASTFHTGGGATEGLTVVHTVSNSPTKLHVRLDVITSNGAATFGGVQAVFAEFAPSDWQPLSRDLIASSARRGLVSIIAQTFAGLKTFLAAPKYTQGAAATSDATVSGVVNAQFTQVGNVGAGPDDLMTYTLPANSLNANGKAVRVTAWGAFANNANNKTLDMFVGGSSVANGPGTFTNKKWRVEVTAIRVTSTSIHAVIMMSVGDATQIIAAEQLLYSQLFTVGIDTSAGIVFKMVATTSTADNDIVQNGMLVEVVG